ncbi:MAG: hypothetical protein M3Z33_00320 [Actinomycetota bacterium]|nr:hypothetical protein [Actinomycetota bacterium]
MLDAHRASAVPDEPAIFVSHTRRRARAVNAAAGLLAAAITLWLVALVGGATDFVDLPVLHGPVEARLSSARRVVGTHAPAVTRASLSPANVVLRPGRRHVGRGLRS